MSKFICLAVAGAALVSATPAARANPYITARIGVSDFVINSNQYMYYSAESPKSTVVDGVISDVNASYHAALGYEFNDAFRLDLEYSYGRFAMGGAWSLNTKNLASGEGVVALPPNISYPSNYTLVNKVNTFTMNGYYNVFTFDRRYKNRRYKNRQEQGTHCYDALYVMATLGMAHIRDHAAVEIDTTLAWGGNPLHEYDSNTLNRFIFGAGMGLAFGLSPHFDVDIAYKYLNMGEYDVGQTTRSYSRHDMTLGLRYTF